MTNVQQNIASEMQQIASELLSVKMRMLTLTQMYTNEGMATLPDSEFAKYAELAHITAAEFQGAGAALVAINTTLGDFTANSNTSKLSKILKSLPK
jgi:hypothetical protein